jgi:hypothetical protein
MPTGNKIINLAVTRPQKIKNEIARKLINAGRS